MQIPVILAALALPLAITTAPASAATTYRAICVFDELKCGGSIQLRNYKPEPGCENSECAALSTGGAAANNTTGSMGAAAASAATSKFSILPTCTTDIAADTDKHLKGKSYVLVQNYKAGASCAGDAESAIAIVTDGKCYPSSDGKSSHKATMADDMAVTWMQYTDAACGAMPTEAKFTSSEVDGKMCVKDTMKVLAVKAGATQAPKASGTGGGAAAGATTKPPTSAASSMSTVAGTATVVTAMASLALFH
ncbi:hypothetical protein PINS_up020984 [Pythium insidiosum]|nr:hypothetical protein PINS_up020984 [Pythium insidiosum]